MYKVFLGAIGALVCVVGMREAYVRGYNKGVDECKRIVTVASEVAKTVREEEDSK